MSFKPPADADRCQYGKDLCWQCWTREDDGETVPRVQEAAR